MALSVGRRGALGGAIAAGLPRPGVDRASAQRGSTLRLGVLTEISGPNSAATGQGSVLATRMAVQDFIRANPGLAVEVVEADHQTKADLAVEHRPRMARPRRHGLHHLPEQFRGGAGGGGAGAGARQGRLADRSGLLRPDRQGLQPEPRPLDV